MGKGDPKTKRGKISIGSYGNTRKHKKPVATPPTKKAPAKKAAPKKEASKKVPAKKAATKKDVIKKEATEAKAAANTENTEKKIEA